MVTGGGIKLMLTFIITYTYLLVGVRLHWKRWEKRDTPCPENGNVNNALALQSSPSLQHSYTISSGMMKYIHSSNFTSIKSPGICNHLTGLDYLTPSRIGSSAL